MKIRMYDSIIEYANKDELSEFHYEKFELGVHKDATLLKLKNDTFILYAKVHYGDEEFEQVKPKSEYEQKIGGVFSYFSAPGIIRTIYVDDGRVFLNENFANDSQYVEQLPKSIGEVAKMFESTY